ncbi:Grap2 and cyclin-D-interacting-domain-containing protein [Tribonema minus]|uniref:Grap2 and cyclin-D-interacting-domain-containing protein n=1 Tax=Tribonema minus TaxID=303371 RepID=A0A836CN71_9STRA|nr:Grap2 and cyclin-D-interacting-domain-containing protein [Tribonema minus]
MSALAEGSTQQQLQWLAAKADAQLQATAAIKPHVPPQWQLMSWATPSDSLKVALSVMLTAANSISGSSTRFTLLFKTAPPPEITAGMVNEMGSLSDHLASSLAVALAPEQGVSPSLAVAIIGAVRAVQVALLELVKSVAAGPSTEPEWNHLTGALWEACKGVAEVPTTNKLAVRMQLMCVSMSIKDTIDEFKAALEAAEAADGGLSGEVSALSISGSADNQSHEPGKTADSARDEAVDSFDDLVDYMDGEGADEDAMSPAEAEAAAAVVELLRTSRACIKTANDAMAAATGSGAARGVMAWAGPLCEEVQSLAEQVGDVGMALYPPMEGAAVVAAADGFGARVTACLDKVDAAQERDAAAVEHLRGVLTERLDAKPTRATRLSPANRCRKAAAATADGGSCG